MRTRTKAIKDLQLGYCYLLVWGSVEEEGMIKTSFRYYNLMEIESSAINSINAATVSANVMRFSSLVAFAGMRISLECGSRQKFPCTIVVMNCFRNRRLGRRTIINSTQSKTAANTEEY